MALRLTGIPTPDNAAGTSGDVSARPTGGGLNVALGSQTRAATPAPAPAAQSPSAFGAQLRDQARMELAFNHLDRYQALFERTAEHEDSHARYHARVLLIEEGLS